eukprot:scaffold118722_cov60-Phaeocystis_antarctica.AAC.5
MDYHVVLVVALRHEMLVVLQSASAAPRQDRGDEICWCDRARQPSGSEQPANQLQAPFACEKETYWHLGQWRSHMPAHSATEVMPCSLDTHVPDPPPWQSPAPCGIAAQTPACACTFFGGSPVQALDTSTLCSRLALQVSVVCFAPRQYTLRRYTSPVAGTVTVRLPFAGPCAGAMSHTPGFELQLVTPSPRSNPRLAVAGATLSTSRHTKKRTDIHDNNR